MKDYTRRWEKIAAGETFTLKDRALELVDHTSATVGAINVGRVARNTGLAALAVGALAVASDNVHVGNVTLEDPKGTHIVLGNAHVQGDETYLLPSNVVAISFSPELTQEGVHKGSLAAYGLGAKTVVDGTVAGDAKSRGLFSARTEIGENSIARGAYAAGVFSARIDNEGLIERVAKAYGISARTSGSDNVGRHTKATGLRTHLGENTGWGAQEYLRQEPSNLERGLRTVNDAAHNAGQNIKRGTEMVGDVIYDIPNDAAEALWRLREGTAESWDRTREAITDASGKIKYAPGTLKDTGAAVLTAPARFTEHLRNEVYNPQRSLERTEK